MTKKKILVIEDDQDSREVVTLWLEKNHFDVSGADNGTSALEQVEKDFPDLIVLDVSMPEMDGYTFLREFKRLYPTASIPVIVLSGRDKLDDLFRFEGVRDYLVKPCDLDEFLKKVKKYLPDEPFAARSCPID